MSASAVAPRVADVIALPPDAACVVRARLGLAADAPLRISYIPGPGDVVDTYDFWREGRTDPTVPVLSYLTMFCELAHQLAAEAQIMSLHAFPDGVGAADRIRFDHIPRQATSSKADYRAETEAYLSQLETALEAFDPHVVVVASYVPFVGWPRLARSRRLVLSLHNTFWPMGQAPGGLTGAWRQMKHRRLVRALSGVVATSEECARQIGALSGGRLTGPVEFPQTKEPYPLRPRHQARNLLFLGRIEVFKGVFRLIEAFDVLRGDYPELSLTFAGRGGAAEALTQAVADRPDTDIRFLGRLDSAGVHDAIAEADLVVIPTEASFQEGLALVAFEGAAHGVPSVMSGVVPAAQALGAGAAVFDTGNTQSLIDTLRGILADDARYQAMQAALAPVRTGLADRSRSWGSQLYRALAAL